MDMLELLCQHSADMSLGDNVGATVLHYAAQSTGDSQHAARQSHNAPATGATAIPQSLLFLSSALGESKMGAASRDLQKRLHRSTYCLGCG